MQPPQQWGGGQRATFAWNHPPCTSSALTGGRDAGVGTEDAGQRSGEEAESEDCGQGQARASLEEMRGRAAGVLSGLVLDQPGSHPVAGASQD